MSKERPEATGVFHTMPVRLIGERDERRDLSARALNYHHPYLDDLLRAILPHDLILLSAPSGLGKTDLALSIAVSNALKEFRVGYFALEAEPRELERRSKFAWLSAEAWRRRIDRCDELNYTDWVLHRCEDILGDLNEVADAYFARSLSTLWTFYRGEQFNAANLCKSIEEQHHKFDLMVIDHLHYVDTDEDKDENRSIGETVKVIRDVALRIGKPILVVAHLRKRDQRLKQLMPGLEDIHGSKHITNICTQVITIGPATVVDAPNWWLAPTFMQVIKDRRAGAPPYVALTMFDKRTRRYGEDYTLGRLTKGGTAWEQVRIVDQPKWARNHKQMEMEV